MTDRELVLLRDRIGLMPEQYAKGVLQRLTWIMSDPKIINTAISDVVDSRS